jgi:hypothetical protein
MLWVSLQPISMLLETVVSFDSLRLKKIDNDDDDIE